MFRRAVIVSTAIAFAAVGTAALAQSAQVSAPQGSVYANRGGQMIAVRQGSALQAGDRVVAANGTARILYADGCNVTVAARSMVTVAANSPCAGGSSSVVKVSTKADDGSEGYGEGWAFENGAWVFIGAGVVTAAVTAAALSDDNKKPASP